MLDVEVGFIQIYPVTFVGLSLTQWEAFAKIVLAERRSLFVLQAFSFPLCRIPFLVRGLLWKSRVLRLSLLLSLPSEGREKRGGLGMHLVLLPVGLPLPLDLCPARGVAVLLDARPVRVGTSVSSAPSGAGVPGVSRSRRSPAACSDPSSVGFPSHHCTLCEVMG